MGTPEEDGYVLATEHRVMGAESMGVRIYVQMSAREVDPRDKDWDTFYEAMAIILKGLEKTTIETSPDFEAKKKKTRDSFAGMFRDAGLDPIFMEELPNGYCPDDPFYLTSPWFKVTSRIGHIVIGDRKRVTSIDWSGTTVERLAAELFPDEDVTKENRLIHAWTDEKVVEYLKALAANGGA